jgi:hypothetical protein
MAPSIFERRKLHCEASAIDPLRTLTS